MNETKESERNVPSVETAPPEKPRRKSREEQFSVDPETGWTLRNGVPIFPVVPGRVITVQMVEDWLDQP